MKTVTNNLIAVIVTMAFCFPLIGMAAKGGKVETDDPYAPVVDEKGQVSIAMDPMKSAHVIIRVRNPDGSFSTEEVIGIEAAQERLQEGAGSGNQQ